MLYKDNWEETKEKFTNYWQQKNTGRPLMRIIARKPEIEHLSDGEISFSHHLICHFSVFHY